MEAYNYYTTLSNMKRRMDKTYRSKGFNGPWNKEAFFSWQKESRKLLSSLLGMDKIQQDINYFEFSPVIKDKKELDDGIIREHLFINTEEDVIMPIFILHPQGESKGTFIALPGHNGGGKYTVSGDTSSPLFKEKIDKYDYDYGLELTKMGYTVVCPDSRGFGERREKAMQGSEGEKIIKGSCKELSNMATSLGFSLQGLFLWDNQRLIDYLETRNDIQLSNLGVVGFSGGGMQALYLSAMDERIKRTIISGYFYGFKDSLLVMNSNCQCNYVPSLFRYFDICDIASLIAPRPLAIQASKDDRLEGERGMENVFEQLKIVQKTYSLFDKTVYLDERDGDHSFHKEGLPTILKHLEER